MKILALKDKKLGDITPMLEYIKTSYWQWTDVTWEIREIDATNLPWSVYYDDAMGLSPAYVAAQCADIFKRHNYGFDHVIWFFSRENWHSPGIGGWNLGRLYSNYSVELVLAEQSGKWPGKTLGMEIAHALDELARVELGMELDNLSGLDWDNDIVHGEHPDWGVPSTKSSTGFFTNYDYTKLIVTFGPTIKKIYAKRREREAATVALLQEIVRLLRKLILAYGAVPIHAPLEGEHHHHDS